MVFKYSRSRRGAVAEEKNALPLFQETKRSHKHSAVPLSVAVPSRGAAAHRPPSRAGALSGTRRPYLLTRSLSAGGSKVIFTQRSRPPRTETAALCAGTEGLLVLFHAKCFILPDYRITFFPFVKVDFAGRAGAARFSRAPLTRPARNSPCTGRWWSADSAGPAATPGPGTAAGC